MATKPLPPAEFLRECFSYDPETGKLRWRRRPISHFPTLDSAKAWNAQCAGRLALTTDYDGHLRGEIRVDGDRVRMYAHRVIFKIMTGRDPAETRQTRSTTSTAFAPTTDGPIFGKPTTSTTRETSG